MTLVAGVDSSTQSCKVVVRELESGRVVRSGSAPHPPGTEVWPERWWDALCSAIGAAGGLDDVDAISIAGQQHGMICLDADGRVVRPALLWNDTRSAEAADDLVRELGAAEWAGAVGTVPVASVTVSKLRWLADHEPEQAARIAAVALPHDWLTWRLRGGSRLDELTTDASDASGTGYFDPRTRSYRRDLLGLALRRDVRDIVLPRVLGPGERAATVGSRLVLGPGCGDNAGAALGLGIGAGTAILSLGTSGVVAAVSESPSADPTGAVAGFADATGRFLPLACTLNAARVLEATAAVLGVELGELDALALAAPAGAGGLVQVPYLEGERTPNLPHATGSLHGMTLASMTRENLARAAVEGLVCLMADAAAALHRLGIPFERFVLVGGGARSAAVREIAPAVLAAPVDVPPPGEYVAEGAARQAAWALLGGDQPPEWPRAGVRTYSATPTPDLLTRYRSHATHHSRTPRSDQHPS
ncbi:xylulokinase [Nocardia sp. NPDC003482]